MDAPAGLGDLTRTWPGRRAPPMLWWHSWTLAQARVIPPGSSCRGFARSLSRPPPSGWLNWCWPPSP